MPELQDEQISRLHSAIRAWQGEIAAGLEALLEAIGESQRLLHELLPMIHARATPDVLDRVARAIDAWRAEVSDTQRALAAAVTDASRQVEALLNVLTPDSGAVSHGAEADMRRLQEKLEASERTRREIEGEYAAVLRALEEREAALAQVERGAAMLDAGCRQDFADLDGAPRDEQAPLHDYAARTETELADLRTQLAEREREVRATGEDAAALNLRLAAMEAELEPLRAQFEMLGELRNQIAGQEEVIARREAALAEARADLERALNGDGARENVRARDEEIARLRARLDAREAEVERLNLGAEQAAEALNALYAQIEALREGGHGERAPAARIADLERQLEAAREQAEAAVARAGALAGELEAAEPAGEAAGQVARLETELAAAREREAQLLNDLAAARQLAEAFEERLARAAREPGAGGDDAGLDEEIAMLRRELAEARAEKDAEFAMAAEAHQRETNRLRQEAAAAALEAELAAGRRAQLLDELRREREALAARNAEMQAVLDARQDERHEREAEAGPGTPDQEDAATTPDTASEDA